jgi:hypothetical protein
MAALEAATQCDWPIATAGAVAEDILARADARLLGGRVKPGHDEFNETTSPDVASLGARTTPG